MKANQELKKCEKCKSDITIGVSIFSLKNNPIVCSGCKSEYVLNPINYAVMFLFLVVILVAGIFIDPIREYVQGNKSTSQTISWSFIAAVFIATHLAKSVKKLVPRNDNSKLQDAIHAVTVSTMYAVFVIVPIFLALSIFNRG